MMYRKRKGQAGFSLIELLIVIGIVGMLTALILPNFETTKENTTDVVSDFNQAGAIRYVMSFKAVNGVFPAGFHTGLTANVDANSTLMNAMNVDTAWNLSASAFVEDPDHARQAHADTATGANHQLTGAELMSLRNAGVKYVSYGGFNSSLALTTAHTGTGNAVWTGDIDETVPTGVRVRRPDVPGGTGGENVTIEGMTVDEFRGTSDTDPNSLDTPKEVVPLFVCPSIDWEWAYKEMWSTSSDVWKARSVVRVSVDAKDPAMDFDRFQRAESWRYYICLFALDRVDPPDPFVKPKNEAAELVGTLSPTSTALNP
jgi:prepilin-type N-terminal cleavage/methylation domain-containing protein